MINSSNSVAIFIACSISFQSVDCLLNCVSWGSFCSVPIGSQFFENAEITFSSSEYIWIICSSSLSSRSEEHTSELQSRGHLVCRLLLEKKRITTPHSL